MLSHQVMLSQNVMLSHKVSMVSHKVVLSHKVMLSCQALRRSAPDCEPADMRGLRPYAATLAQLVFITIYSFLLLHQENNCYLHLYSKEKSI